MVCRTETKLKMFPFLIGKVLTSLATRPVLRIFPLGFPFLIGKVLTDDFAQWLKENGIQGFHSL